MRKLFLAYQFPHETCWMHVPVAHSCHRDHRPPEGGWDRGELGALHVLFRKVAETGEHKHPYGQEQHKEGELLVAVLEGVGDGLQP